VSKCVASPRGDAGLRFSPAPFGRFTPFAANRLGMRMDRHPTAPPKLVEQAWNLARALADFVADNCRTATAEEYRRRLEICDGCGYRRANRCLKCGCRLSLKARGRAFKCPLGKWPVDAR
jgi:hypothetical protein